MNKHLRITMAVMLAGANATGQSRNQISGSVVGPDKLPVSGPVSVLVSAVPPTGTAIQTFQPFNLRVPVNVDGSFVARDLPDATYRLCPGAGTTLWLNPCDWKAPLLMTVKGGQALSAAPIELVQGERLLLRVQDESGLLQAHLGKTTGAEYQIILLTGQNLPAPLRLLGQDAKGQSLEALVASDQAVRLVVSSGFFQIGDNQGRALGRRPGVLSYDPIVLPAVARGTPRTAEVRVTGLLPAQVR